MAEKIDLVIIDPQNSFCDPQKGELYVPGAEHDMKRVSDFVKKMGTKINRIHVTLDCHHLIDVSHSLMWKNSKGEHPAPFTSFGSKEIKDGIWNPIYPSLINKFITYCETLEIGGKYSLCIWPNHCLIGSQGCCVFLPLFQSLLEWEEKKKNNVFHVSKGSNPYTEHYSAVKAEVPEPDDPSTQLNTRFINTIKEADKILVAGEAGSHCLKFSVEDIADGFNDDSYIKKIVLLEDGTSPVQSPFVDFPAIQEKFVANMKSRGMQVAKTTDF